MNDDSPESNCKKFFESLCKERSEKMSLLVSNLDQVVLERIKLVDAKLFSITQATTLARESMEHRLQGMNQFREDITKDRDQFVRKESYDVKIKSYDDWMRAADVKLTRIETKAMVWSSVVGFLAILASLLIHVWSAIKAP